MAFKPHTLVSFGGALGSGATAEIWQSGVRVCTLDQSPHPDPAALMNFIQPHLKTWFQTLVGSTALLSTAHLDWLKVNNIDAAGHYSDPTHVHRFDYSPSVIGGGIGGNGVPWILTSAITWRTNLVRGPGSRGRVYLPLYLAPNGLNTPYLTAGQQSDVCTLGRNLLLQIGVSDGAIGAGVPGVIPVVASRKNATLVPISQISCGSVFDIQRRRKDRLRETYTTIAL